MSVFTYRLYLENGEDLGNFATAVPGWSVGNKFFDKDHNVFRILDIVSDEAMGSEQFSGVFVVVPAELAEPG